MKIKDAIRDEIRRELKNPKCVLLGEDIATPQGGAFGVTYSLADEFPNQVINTPISEQAITGIATGLALSGYKVILEIMMGDWLTLCLDQILNHISKIPKMYGENISLPILIRTPMGGRRGYGPTHSQSLERFFVGIPNLSVYAINQATDFIGIYNPEYGPKIIFEYKCLYDQPLLSQFEMSDYHNNYSSYQPFVWAKDAKVTVFTYGEMLREVSDAYRTCLSMDLKFNIACPSQIYPLNRNSGFISIIVEYVKSSGGKLLTVEEGSTFASVGSEIIACCGEAGVLKKAMRLGNDGIVPCSMALENKALPGRRDIVDAIERLAG